MQNNDGNNGFNIENKEGVAPMSGVAVRWGLDQGNPNPSVSHSQASFLPPISGRRSRL